MSTFSELIDFTRSSTGTYLDSVVYGDELVTNGDFSNGTTGWNANSSTLSIDNQRLKVTATASYGEARYDIPTETGKTYKVTLDYIRGDCNGYVEVRNQGFNVNLFTDADNAYTANTTREFTFVATDPVSVLRLLNSHGTSSGNYNFWDNVSVKEIIGGQGAAGTPLLRTADTNEPRLEYDASGQPLGLLIEEQRTNLLYHSEAFDNGYWSKENTNVTSNQIVAPDGTNSADKIIEANTTNTFHFITRSMSLSAGAKTFSAYFKKAERDFAALTLRVDGGAKRLAVIFDLTNGTVADTLTLGSPTQTNSTIENAGNGWYRCSVTAYHSTGAILTLLSPQDDGNGGGNINMDYAGTVGYGVYAWGAQLEEGSFPTSYIPTSGSTVTRNKDLQSVPSERFGVSSSSTIAILAKTANISSASYLCELGKNNNDRIFMKAHNSQHLVVILSGSTTATLDAGTFTSGDYGKAATAIKDSDYAAVINGGAVATQSSGSLPSSFDKIYLGTNGINNGEHLNGHIKRIQYFPKRLSNDELVELTKPSSSPTMSLTFDGQATSELVEGLHD